MDGRTYVRTHGQTFETGFIRSTQKSRPDNSDTYITQLTVVIHIMAAL